MLYKPGAICDIVFTSSFALSTLYYLLGLLSCIDWFFPLALVLLGVLSFQIKLKILFVILFVHLKAQILIHLNSLHHPIRETEGLLLTVKSRLCLVDDAAIYHHLHASRLPMPRHATRSRLLQVMKLHRNLKSLTQSGTIYEFLVEEHVNLLQVYCL